MLFLISILRQAKIFLLEFLTLIKYSNNIYLKTQNVEIKASCGMLERDKQILNLQNAKDEAVALYANSVEELNKKREECLNLNFKCSEVV